MGSGPRRASREAKQEWKGREGQGRGKERHTGKVEIILDKVFMDITEIIMSR